MSGSNRLPGLTARPKDTGAEEARKIDVWPAALWIALQGRNQVESLARELISCIQRFSLRWGRQLPQRLNGLE